MSLPITDYVTLRDAVIAWYEHETVAVQYETILQLAEVRLKNDVQIRQIEQSIYGTLTAPVLPFPVDAAAIQRLVILRGSQEIALEYAAPGTNEHLTGTPSKPRSYTVYDQSIIIYPSPDQSYEYALYYIPEVRTLTPTAPTNDILKRAPNIYVYACLAEAAIFLRNFELGENYLTLYAAAWRDYQSASDRSRFPLSTPLRVKMRQAA